MAVFTSSGAPGDTEPTAKWKNQNQMPDCIQGEPNITTAPVTEGYLVWLESIPGDL